MFNVKLNEVCDNWNSQEIPFQSGLLLANIKHMQYVFPTLKEGLKAAE